jgi:hypothetical protein
MLDLRLPIGYFFLINSLLLIVSGLIQPQMTTCSAGTFNLNVTWGAVFGLFGMVMAALGWSERLANKASATSGAGAEPSAERADDADQK